MSAPAVYAYIVKAHVCCQGSLISRRSHKFNGSRRLGVCESSVFTEVQRPTQVRGFAKAQGSQRIIWRTMSPYQVAPSFRAGKFTS